MATGSYSCSSNTVEVTDETAVKRLLNKYDHHRQVSLREGRLSVSSPSDTLMIDGPNGHERERSFLEELAEYLDSELRIKNMMDPPYGDPSVGIWRVSPDGEVSYEEV